MSIKIITIKAIEKEIGVTDSYAVSDHQAFLMVYGAAEWLGDQALEKGTRVTQVESPSRASMKKLAKKLITQTSRTRHYR